MARVRNTVALVQHTGHVFSIAIALGVGLFDKNSFRIWAVGESGLTFENLVVASNLLPDGFNSRHKRIRLKGLMPMLRQVCKQCS